MSIARWATRLRHRFCDTVDLVAFSLCPLRRTKIQATKSCTITIEQWRGSDVGSGGYVWGAARQLVGHLQEYGDGCAAVGRVDNPAGSASVCTLAVASRPWSKLTVLELGAGTGAVGLVAAALGANAVTLTDQAAFIYPTGPNGTKPKAVTGGRSLLDLMRRNVLAFIAADNARAYCEPVVREMVWGCGKEMRALLPHASYDLICASDVLLFSSAHKDLTATLRAMSKPSTIILIQHTDRDGKEVNSGNVYPHDLLAFLHELEKDALWTPTVVRDYGRHLTLRLVRTLDGAPPFAMAALAARANGPGA